MKLFSHAAFVQWLILARTWNYQRKSIAVKRLVPGLIFIYSKKEEFGTQDQDSQKPDF